MQTRDFNYTLPQNLIAQHPPAERGQSRLLTLVGQTIRHQQFESLHTSLHPDDLLVLNDTRVVPARLYGNKASGGQIECLFERILTPNTGLFHIKASKAPKPGTRVFISGYPLEVIDKQSHLYQLHALDIPIFDLLHAHGHIPLPPYITRADTIMDSERYQSVFANYPGAVAAPTASLHFTKDYLQKFNHTTVTLHVGAGTFMPVRTAHLHEHKMHSEVCEVGQATIDKINATRAKGRRVIAVGTTVVRALESANGQRFCGETDIFITPGYQFNTIDGLVTNFHLPESTLLMLVSALATRELILNAYHQAIVNQYRFFSYGDAMLILP